MTDTNNKPEGCETICHNCIFATYSDPSREKTQTGCHANMLARFVKQGIEPKEYYDDDGNEFFGIPNRVCPFLRFSNWKEKQPSDSDLVAIARDELTLRMEVIIYIEKDGSFETIGTTLDSLANGKIKPSRVIFCDNFKIKPSAFRKWLDGRCRMGWRCEHVTEDNADFYRCIDICMKKIKSINFAAFHAGFKVPEDFISNLDIAINDNLERFLYLRPCDLAGNGIVMQRLIAKPIGGHRDSLLLDKLERVAEVQKCQYLVKDVVELVPSLKT
jgi:hypothetical protein